MALLYLPPATCHLGHNNHFNAGPSYFDFNGGCEFSLASLVVEYRYYPFVPNLLIGPLRKGSPSGMRGKKSKSNNSSACWCVISILSSQFASGRSHAVSNAPLQPHGISPEANCLVVQSSTFGVRLLPFTNPPVSYRLAIAGFVFYRYCYLLNAGPAKLAFHSTPPRKLATAVLLDTLLWLRLATSSTHLLS